MHLLQQRGELEHLQHILSVVAGRSVAGQADRNAAAQVLSHRRHPGCQDHIADGTVADVHTAFPKGSNVLLAHVHRMYGRKVRAEYPAFIQKLDRRFSVAAMGELIVVGGLVEVHGDGYGPAVGQTAGAFVAPTTMSSPIAATE